MNTGFFTHSPPLAHSTHSSLSSKHDKFTIFSVASLSAAQQTSEKEFRLNLSTECISAAVCKRLASTLACCEHSCLETGIPVDKWWLEYFFSASDSITHPRRPLCGTLSHATTLHVFHDYQKYDLSLASLTLAQNGYETQWWACASKQLRHTQCAQ